MTIEIESYPNTDIEIISGAISLVGKQQSVNTIDGSGALGVSAQKLYGTLVGAELGSNRWRFAQQFKQISILTTLEPNFDGWLYEAQIPADCIMVQYVTPNIDYIVFGDKILTKNNQTFTLIYSRVLPVSKWPPPFSMYIMYHLAGMLGMSITNSDRMIARIEKGMLMWQSRALFADAQSSTTQPFRYNPYVDVRYRYKTRGY